MLRNNRTRVKRNAVSRILRDRNLSPAYAKHRKVEQKKRNLSRPMGPNQMWETDITYIPTQQGMAYPVAIWDCFTKEWVGYQYSRSCLSRDAIMAVEVAIVKAFDGEVPEGLVLRVDNCPQYIQKHTSEGNGDIESFHSSLKTDYVCLYEFQDYWEASVAIESAFIDYNEKRHTYRWTISIQGSTEGGSWMTNHSGKAIPGNSM